MIKWNNWHFLEILLWILIIVVLFLEQLTIYFKRLLPKLKNMLKYSALLYSCIIKILLIYLMMIGVEGIRNIVFMRILMMVSMCKVSLKQKLLILINVYNWCKEANKIEQLDKLLWILKAVVLIHFSNSLFKKYFLIQKVIEEW
jgi:hypothetical protein